MKKLLFLGIIFTVLILFSACGGKTPIPSGTLPASDNRSDDIVFTPGGGTYRANVFTDNVTNPWPPIPVAAQDWSKGKDTISVMYRSNIDTKAGETHNDLILVSGEDTSGNTTYQLTLYAAAVPKGITLTNAGGAVGRPGTPGAVVVFALSPQIAAGEYIIDIGIELNGKDFGTVPCRVTVTQ